ncbi:acetyl-CoA synthetase-like protein [Atractiella rhizophila]|nr:acetyl-CoA synthetase-like protein [Atractiella rhizophila]
MEGKEKLVNGKQLLSPHTYGAPTVWHAFLRALQVGGGSNPCIGTRTHSPTGGRGPFEYQTYGTIDARMQSFLSGLRVLGYCKGRGEKVGLSGENSIEWVIAYLAIIRSANVPLVIPPTHGSSDIDLPLDFRLPHLYIIPVRALHRYTSLISSETPPTFVLIDGDAYELDEVAFDVGAEARLYTFGEVERLGRNWALNSGEKIGEVEKPGAEEVAEVAFTCAEDGQALRAVELTHRQIAASIASLHTFSAAGHFLPLSPSQSYLVPLPLWHFWTRHILLFAMYTGSSIALSNLSIHAGELLEDLESAKPTVLVTIGGVLDGLVDKLQQHPPTSLIASTPDILQTAISQKLSLLHSSPSQAPHSVIWDTLLFSHFASLTGSHLKHVISSSSPLKKETREMLAVMLSVQTWDVFCVTGVGGVISLNDRVADSVQVEISESTGEVNARSWAGWYCTGDRGVWTSKRKLQIVGRTKEHFKPSLSLTYIHPPSLSALLCQAEELPEVLSLFIHGHPSSSHLTVYAHLDRAIFSKWAAEKNLEKLGRMVEGGKLLEWVEGVEEARKGEWEVRDEEEWTEWEERWCEKVRDVARGMGFRGAHIPRKARIGFEELPKVSV